MYASIESKNGFAYQLTDEDVLWATRMAAYEGGSVAAALWTVTQRYVNMAPDMSFGSFVQAFSQPINPKWTREGIFCRPGGEYEGTDSCSESRLQRRERARDSTLEQIKAEDPNAYQTTQKWAQALLKNPVPGAVDFAAPSVASGWLARNRGSIVAQIGNVFLATADSLRWPRNFVTMRLGARVAGDAKKIWPWALGAAAVGAVGWWFWRRKR